MDGVLWRRDTPINDLPAIFKKIANLNLKFVFATNNATLTPEGFVEKLRNYGVHVLPDQIITSAVCTGYLLGQRFPPGTPVYAIGEDGIVSALLNNKYTLLTVDEAEHAKAVVVSLDRQVTFNKMRAATLLVGRGVPFYATNPDKTFPTPEGEIPGAGAWISVITIATGIDPIYAGKPYPTLFNLALKKLATSPSETLVVGDRLETDITAGQTIGCVCALVLSGVSSRAQAEAWQPAIDLIADNLSELLE